MCQVRDALHLSHLQVGIFHFLFPLQDAHDGTMLKEESDPPAYLLMMWSRVVAKFSQ